MAAESRNTNVQVSGTAAELRNASKHYGTLKALENVSFAIQPGETVALLGPNGAGKTTAISLLLGLRPPTSGQALIYGQDPRTITARRRIGVMLQESGLPNTLRVSEIVELFRRNYPTPLSVAAALEAAGLTEKAQVNVTTLSGGQKQRLYFALAIVGNPDVIFLDEPTVGMDVESRQHFWGHINQFVQQGKTILLTTHYLEEADVLASRIIMIANGQIIAEGTPQAIKERVGGKTVRFRAPELTSEQLTALPGVERLEHLGTQFSFYCLAPEPILCQLFHQGIELHELEITGTGLEEAFLALTQRTAPTSAKQPA